MILLFSYILFWFLVYYIEATHDAFITKETNEHPLAPNAFMANYYKGKWHTWDSYQFAIWHIVIALLISFSLHQDFLTLFSLALTLTFTSVSVRIVAHDLFYDLAMNRSIYTIPTCQGKWDWWDCTLVWINKHTFIHPFYLRFIPLFISISIYYVFFIS
jgi:hypothetical protein